MVVAKPPLVDQPRDREGVGPAVAPDPGIDLVNFAVSIDSGSIETLELANRRIGPAFVQERFDQISGTHEVAVLKTCHRTELFVLGGSASDRDRWADALSEIGGPWTRRDGAAAVSHLFRVAAGLESTAVGEAEVRRQVRDAAAKVTSRYPRPVLRPLFERAVATAEALLPTVGPERSIAAVAASRVLETVGRPFPRVVVVGSGVVGRQVADLLAPFARLTVVYRYHPPEETFLRTIGARAAPIEGLSDELDVADAVVACAKSGSTVVSLSKPRTAHPLVVVDLGVPRNVDPNAATVPGVTVVDLESLYRTARLAPLPAATMAELERRAAAAVDELRQEQRTARIDRLWREAESARQAELDVARPFLGPLTPVQQAAVDRLTRRLVIRLLARPLSRLKSVRARPDDEAEFEAALELFTDRP